jgi:hypothetical protein
MGTVTQPWSLDDKRTAMDMAAKGHTSAEIAFALRRTRSAVIGYCNRNEIQLGTKPKANRKPRVKKEKFIKIKVERVIPPPQPVEVFVFDESQSKSFMEIALGECRSIIGDAKGFETRYCARPTMRVGCDWCEEHYKLYYSNKRVVSNGNQQNYKGSNKFFARFKV